MIENIIQSVKEKLASLPCIEGIVLGGSRARGTHAKDSDIDIGIYYDPEAIDLDGMNQLAAELDDEHRRNLLVAPGGWGNWVNAGGWLSIHGFHVDLILRDIKRVKQILQDTEQGIVTANYQTGHPHGYLSSMYRGELAISKLQYAKDNSFYELKKQAEDYPAAMQKGIIDLFMFEAGFSHMLAEKNMDKDDIFYVCGHCFRSIAALNQVLFALNKEYCINEKRAVKMIEDFRIKVSNYKESVDQIISFVSTDADDTKKGLALLQSLINEVEQLKNAVLQ